MACDFSFLKGKKATLMVALLRFDEMIFEAQ